MILWDEVCVECGGAYPVTRGDAADGFGAALPAFAGRAAGGRRLLSGALTGASARSVQHWCTLWRRSSRRRQPEKALGEPPRRGRRPVVPTLNRARLLSELAQAPSWLGYATANWTVPLLAHHLRQRCRLPVSARTLRRRLHAAGLRWKRPRFVFAEPEPHPAQKKRIFFFDFRAKPDQHWIRSRLGFHL
jgi:transposase